ncbi:phage terminase large subunit family protein [Pseudomonas aeruginosa]|nr:phage terminase large subunit family protein [Pseudomonas aeruginosa]
MPGAAEPGKYHTDRTPYAREPMRCLSPLFPAKRVVTMVASQLMKTQVALNWIGGCIHRHRPTSWCCCPAGS